MGGTSERSSVEAAAAWTLAARQHGVVTRRQLLDLGFSRHAVAHRIASGRLHPVHRGVYAVGRPGLTRHGRWLAAVLACGPGALLSHTSAAALWEISRGRPPSKIHVSVPGAAPRRPAGIVVHRRARMGEREKAVHAGVPVTSIVTTIVDLAGVVRRDALEAAINESDKRDLITPDALREALDELSRRPGLPAARATLDRRTFTLTDSELERRFLPIARRAGLPQPQTGARLNGFKVDFHWNDLGLVVETDGLRYHRTPAQQARDRLRDQAHAAAGLTPVRFTHAQVRYEPEHVRATLAAVAARLREGPDRAPAR